MTPSKCCVILSLLMGESAEISHFPWNSFTSSYVRQVLSHNSFLFILHVLLLAFCTEICSSFWCPQLHFPRVSAPAFSIEILFLSQESELSLLILFPPFYLLAVFILLSFHCVHKSFIIFSSDVELSLIICFSFIFTFLPSFCTVIHSCF